MTDKCREELLFLIDVAKNHFRGFPVNGKFNIQDILNECKKTLLKQKQEIQRLREALELQHQNPKLTSNSYEYQQGFLDMLNIAKQALQQHLTTKEQYDNK